MQCPLRRLENGHIAFSPRFSPCLGSGGLSLSACLVWPISGHRRPQAFPVMVSGYEVLTIHFSNNFPVWLRLCGVFSRPFMPSCKATQSPVTPFLCLALCNPIGLFFVPWRDVHGLTRALCIMHSSPSCFLCILPIHTLPH